MSYLRDKTLAILLLLFLATRLIILFFDFSSLTQLEELYNGTLAREMLRGLFLPLLQLRYIEYQSGSLIVSFCAIPFFLIVGESYFSLKLVALLFSAGTLIVYYKLLEKYFSKRIALWAGLLYVFSPPIFNQLNLKVEGANSQAILITMTIWYIFFTLFCVDRHDAQRADRVYDRCSARGYGRLQKVLRKEDLLAILLGFLCSFGIWFCPVVALVIICMGILWFAIDTYFFITRRFMLMLGGSLLGAIPAMVDYVQNNFAGLKYLLVHPCRDRASPVLSKLAELWGPGLLNSFSFKNIYLIPGAVINGYLYSLTIVTIICFIFLRRQQLLSLIYGLFFIKKPRLQSIAAFKEIAFFIYLVIFSLFWSITKFGIEEHGSPMHKYHYYISIYPFIYVVMVLAITDMLTKGWRCVKYFFIIALIFDAACMFSSVVKGHFGEGFQLKGYSYEMLGLRLYENFHNNPDHALDLCQKKLQDESDCESCIMGVVCSVLLECQDRKEVDQNQCLINRLAGVSRMWHPYFYRGRGQYIADQYSRPEDVPLWGTKLQGIPLEYLNYCYQGLGCAAKEICKRDPRRQVEYIQRIAPEFRPAFQHGLTLPWYSL